MPVPDLSVSSVRQGHGRLYRSWYRYRYDMNTGTGHFGKFGKTQPGTGHVGKIGTFLTRSDSELQIFRSDEDGSSYAVGYCKIRWDEI